MKVLTWASDRARDAGDLAVCGPGAVFAEWNLHGPLWLLFEEARW